MEDLLEGDYTSSSNSFDSNLANLDDTNLSLEYDDSDTLFLSDKPILRRSNVIHRSNVGGGEAPISVYVPPKERDTLGFSHF
jgi:hypothetical protein